MSRTTRRTFMARAGAGLIAGSAPLSPFAAFRAAASEPRRLRLVNIILRGGMDGLGAVPPYGDIALADARRMSAVPPPGSAANAAIDLDGFFALNPGLAPIKPYYDNGKLAIVHAVGQTRYNGSHFSSQDNLERGAPPSVGSASFNDGWLNRAWSAIDGDRPIVSLTEAIPLMARGRAPVVNFSESALPDLKEDEYAQVRALFADDEMFATALARTEEMRGLTSSIADTTGLPEGKKMTAFMRKSVTAARLLASPYGPSICCYSSGGWDTHAGQGGVGGRFRQYIDDLGAGLRLLADNLGPALEDTVIVVGSEFGRTALENGTGGTDHGWGGVFFLLGGPVNGGRVVTDWPGLASGATFSKKLLDATTDEYSVLKEVVRDHLRIPEGTVHDRVIPQEKYGAKPLDLIRT